MCLCRKEFDRSFTLQEEGNKNLGLIVDQLSMTNVLLSQIVALITPPPSTDITGFTEITETTMVALAPGQTATFSTTPIPSTSVPVAANIVWTSSDTTNAPVSPNSADTTGLSTIVVFPTTAVVGTTFSLTVSYANSDGTTATQTNSFTIVAAPPADITGFTAITQTA
jgi:hypothetical protein